MKSPRRFVVTGLPQSGKSTFVTTWRRAGDVVWDFDVILRAVVGVDRHAPAAAYLHLMRMMRSALVEWLLQHDEHGCFLIVCDPINARKLAREIDARILTMPDDGHVIP